MNSPALPLMWSLMWMERGCAVPQPLGDDLVKAWSEPHRHYHTLEHLDECLKLLGEYNHLAEHPFEVELALWFHDAIYDPQSPDNEAKSAQWMVESLSHAHVNSTVIARIRAMILATTSHSMPQTPDEKLMLDIDLAILGAPPERFAAYEDQIRAEYAWVDPLVYQLKRREVLSAFADRKRLYFTDAFMEDREAQARINLSSALAG